MALLYTQLLCYVATYMYGEFMCMLISIFKTGIVRFFLSTWGQYNKL